MTTRPYMQRCATCGQDWFGTHVCQNKQAEPQGGFTGFPVPPVATPQMPELPGFDAWAKGDNPYYEPSDDNMRVRTLRACWAESRRQALEEAAKVCESRITPGTGSVAILNGAADAIKELP